MEFTVHCRKMDGKRTSVDVKAFDLEDATTLTPEVLLSHGYKKPFLIVIEGGKKDDRDAA